MKTKSWLLWTFAFVLTLSSAAYQRITGPTYAVRGRVVVDTAEVAFRLPRSHAGAGDAEIPLSVPDTTVSGTLELRRYRSDDQWSQQPLQRAGEFLVGRIPHQPPAGKVLYRIALAKDERRPVVLTADPVVIRFRGSVPAWALVFHIIVIFAGMLLSTRAGLEALCRRRRVFGLTIWTLVCLGVGGLVLGPLVQKYAFGAYWTGWPFGHDLTDNKIAVAMLFWLLALWRTWKKRTARGWAVAASLVTLVIWLIPHSVLGSELDYTQTPQ